MLANSVTCGNRPIDRISGTQTAGPKVRKSTNKNNQRSENLVFSPLGLGTAINKNDNSRPLYSSSQFSNISEPFFLRKKIAESPRSPDSKLVSLSLAGVTHTQ